jgi:large subunit ribosomal protein L1
MPKRGKKYNEAAKTIEAQKIYTVVEAVELCRNAGIAGFDESVDVVFRLGVNPKYADQMVRGSCLLPHGTGKSLRVVVARMRSAPRIWRSGFRTGGWSSSASWRRRI